MTPHPDDPGPGAEPESPPPPPVHYAEQALLGALILDPQRLHVTRALQPDHFGDPAHHALFTAMRTLNPPAPEEHRRAPVWLESVIASAREHARGLTLAYGHELIRACPRPQHAPSYAQMVLAGHTRRTLRAHAQQLGQAATDTTGPDPAKPLFARVDALGRELDVLARHFSPHPGSLPQTPVPPPPSPTAGEEALDEERLVLASLTAHPDAARNMRWLQAQDFTLPQHGRLYQCVASLAHRGDPIDPVTVLWEAQCRGLLDAHTTPEQVLTVLSTPAGTPEHWGERVLHRALLHHAHTTATHIQAYTNDPANTPHQLVTGTRRALTDLNTVRARWEHTTSQRHPPTTSATRPQVSPLASPARSFSTAKPAARVVRAHR